MILKIKLFMKVIFFIIVTYGKRTKNTVCPNIMLHYQIEIQLA